MKKRLLSLALVLMMFLLLLPAVNTDVYADGNDEVVTVTGLVVDNANEPVPGATVSFTTDATVSTTTDDNGYFEFNNVPTGQKGTLTISKDGYVTKTITTETITEDVDFGTIALNSWSTIGGCLWGIDNGTLTIKPDPSAANPGQLPDNYTTEEQWPWDKNRIEISCIAFEKGVIAGNSVNSMFKNCENLASVDLSDFDTSAVTSMSQMFNHCLSLVSLDLSAFDTSKVTDMDAMFWACSSLKTIYVSDKWSTGNVGPSDGMFANCTNIMGGANTTYDGTNTDKEYARIDGGSTSATPG